MIDSHCHLDHEPLLTNLKEVISSSKAIGIDKLLTICTTSIGYENILKIVEIDPIIYGTFGIHPHETEKFTNVDTKFILDDENKFSAVGISKTLSLLSKILIFAVVLYSFLATSLSGSFKTGKVNLYWSM